MRRTHRLTVILGLALALAILVFASAFVFFPRPGINKANYDRIHDGMTRAEVEAIFGRASDATQETPNGKVDVWWSGNDHSGGANFEGAMIIFKDDRKVGGAFGDWSNRH